MPLPRIADLNEMINTRQKADPQKMVQIWQVVRPELPFDYYAKKYKFCGCSHVKIAACTVLFVSLGMLVYRIIATIWSGWAIMQIIMLPIEVIALIALFIGLKAEHPTALLPYLLAKALMITFYAYYAIRYAITAINTDSEMGYGKELKTKKDHTIEVFHTQMSVESASIFMTISCLVRVVVYSIFFYIVYKCRHYFVDLQRAKREKEPTVTYFSNQTFA
ncbi:unnamed protein product, partial [Mesorhabditis belari]|uniref:Endoplasmic reticulum transmembrane protein n=1 Tax=Mesorhabditis belari TaxID=2138241 RepID=A0AAF3EXE8_9BILA